MLFIYQCLVSIAIVARAYAQFVMINPTRCAPNLLPFGQSYNETFRVAIDGAANREWLRLELSVLVGNRTDYSKHGYGPPHRILFANMDASWSVRLDPTQTADGALSLVRIDRQSAPNDHNESSFDIVVFVDADATGCFNVSGLGIMTQVRFLSSDAFSLRHREMVTAMCAHEQNPACIPYYKPLVRKRDICAACYISFLVFAFILVYMLSH